MDGVTRINGLLGDLQRLTEAGRDRILTLLPQDDVIALLKAALRERDHDQDNISVQTKLHQEPTIHAVREESINAANRTPTTAAPQNRKRRRIDHVHTQIAENRPEPVAVKQEIVDLASDEDNNSITVIQPEIPFKVEGRHPSVQIDTMNVNRSVPIALPDISQTPVIEPPAAQIASGSGSHHGPAGPYHGSSAVSPNYYSLPVSSQPFVADWAQASHTERSGPNDASVDTHGPSNLSVCLLVDDCNGNPVFQSLASLPDGIQYMLNSRFKDMWESRPWSTDNYRQLLQHANFYLSMPTCIRCTVWSSTTAQVESSYVLGGRSRESADDGCIASGLPCAYFVKSPSGIINICFVPLPHHKRMGKAWNQLGYWIDTPLPGDHFPG